MANTYGGSGDNRAGFHGRGRVTPNEGHGGSGQSEGRRVEGTGHHMGAGERPISKGNMSEPTNHGGHTHGMHHAAAHNARVEATRSVHTGSAGGQQGHEKILHETHRLHQSSEPHFSHGNKHGESHHLRDSERGDTPAHERSESAAERKREGE